MKTATKKIIGKLKRIIYKNKVLDFNKFKLTVNYRDSGGRQYESRNSYEEKENLIYDYIANTLKPDLVIDVGANYGFTSLVFRQKFLNAKLVLIEPSPYLHEYLNLNFKDNNVKNYELIKAFCGSKKSDAASFSLNPVSSQDNRVHGQQGWKQIKVPSTTLTDIIRAKYTSQSIFIKIDTQGYETQVFEGAFDFLENHHQWMIKTEFAPHWLISQGNNPHDLLKNLIDRFLVVEAPARIRFFRDRLDQIFLEPLQLEEIGGFIEYVTSLNKDRLGWVDLFVAPKLAKFLAL